MLGLIKDSDRATPTQRTQFNTAYRRAITDALRRIESGSGGGDPATNWWMASDGGTDKDNAVATNGVFGAHGLSALGPGLAEGP